MWQTYPRRLSIFGGIELPINVADDGTQGPVADDLSETTLAFLGLPSGALHQAGAVERLDVNYQANRDFFLPDPLPISNAVELWRYVTPIDIAVVRDRDAAGTPHVVVECNCPWEPEHGLQLVFREGTTLTRLSQYDGHLRDSE